jgi:hypothetical protein
MDKETNFFVEVEKRANFTLSVLAQSNGFENPVEYELYKKLIKHEGNLEKKATYIVHWIEYCHLKGKKPKDFTSEKIKEITKPYFKGMVTYAIFQEEDGKPQYYRIKVLPS